jgi:type II secretory ATPase GspE/PulE/Tfp pilus assembly ATPase PilB-like protein
VRGRTIKVSTIENPVEYEMVGACQMPASSENFEKYLKASLRQDPDVVVVGEIRDDKAAETTKNLVLAGHKIFSTLHVYEAPAAFSRLMQLGVPRGLLSMPGFVSGIVYQRLVPVVCPHCSHKYQDVAHTGMLSEALEARLIRSINMDRDDVRLIREGGCEQCDFLGVIGRTPCAEVLKPDATFLELVRDEKDAAAKAYWYSQLGSRIGLNGSPTALSHAKHKMRMGMLDPRDVEAELSLLNSEN